MKETEEEYKRISYIKINSGWQTYVFPLEGGFIRYKLLSRKASFDLAVQRCQAAGWQVINATNLVTSSEYFKALTR